MNEIVERVSFFFFFFDFLGPYLWHGESQARRLIGAVAA